MSGCITVGPDFQTRESQVAEKWLDAENERVKTDPADTVDGWKRFHDPVLESLIQQAYDRNPTLQIAGLRVFEARTTLGVAVSTFFPQVQQAGATAGALAVSVAVTG